MTLVVGIGLMGAVSRTWASSSGSVDVVLEASVQAEIRIAENAVLLIPSEADLALGYVAAEGAAGIEAEIRSNCATGTALNVRLDAASHGLAPADLWFRTLTPVRGPGVSQQVYTAVRTSDQLVWSSAASLPEWTTVRTDVRLQNLRHYATAPGSGDRTLTSTLIFTVVTQ